MNSIVKFEFDNDDGNLPEFNYLHDQEIGGVLDTYSIYHGGSGIGEFDPMSDPVLAEPWPLSAQYDSLPQLSLEDIEEITQSLDADNLSSFNQGGNNLVGATPPTMMATEPQIPLEHKALVNANPMMTTTQALYPHEQKMFFNAMPVYATITHHEPQNFQTHYASSVYEMKTDQPQHFRDHHYVDNFGNCNNVILNSMYVEDDYYHPLQLDEGILVDIVEPISMIPSKNHLQQCLNVSAANDFGDVKNVMNLKSEQSSNMTAMVKYEEGVIRQRFKTSALELDEIRKYFHLPITKAAKELNVGLTVLKKRCRELNIMRWPHRKIKSLQSLIDNVKETGMTSSREIEMLEENKRMLERVPELELSESTKRLRQSCFKANYKKRRLLLSSAASSH